MRKILVGDISEQLRGVSFAKSDTTSEATEGFLPVLRANNISDSGLLMEDIIYVAANKVSQKQKLRAGDVLIAASSGSRSVVGKAAQVKLDLDVAFGAFCKVLRPSRSVDPGYFGHFFRTHAYRRKVSSLAAGANINNLRGEHLDNLEIAFPSLDEQNRICRILDKADELRIACEQSIEELDKLQRSVFLDMFGDPTLTPRAGKQNSSVILISGELLPAIRLQRLSNRTTEVR